MEKDPLRRKLAVILHADVAGSTLLVQTDEILAHERIRETFKTLAGIAAGQGGSVLEIRGDALIAEFPLASNAVEAALSFQESNAAFVEQLSDEIRPVVRIGIAMGEVVIADNTITGEAVILAQRLEQLAAPGGVCIQGTARDTVPKRLPFEFAALDDVAVKGFGEPVSASIVKRHVTGEAAAGMQSTGRKKAGPELPAKPSIAVLPFDNMSGDPEQDFFSDGITEDIITALSRVSGLMVVARNSTMVYQGKAVDVKQVGREQGVRYVLEGSVRKAANRVRVSCQLIDAVTGLHKYAERFDRELDDIFKVQDEITRQVTIELQVQLTTGEQARIWAGGTENVAAWEHALRADDLIGRHLREENQAAREVVRQAISLDPGYAVAWTTLGLTHWQDARWGWSNSKDESLELAENAARESEKIDANYPGVYSLLGMIFLTKGQYDESLKMLEHAINLAPSHSSNVAWYATTLHYSMRSDDCIRQMKRAMRLSPIFPAWYLVPLAGAHLINGEPNLAHDVLVTAIEREPNSKLPRIWMTITLAELDRKEESRAEALQLLELDPAFSITAWTVGLEFKDPSWSRKLEQNLRDAGLPD